ALAQHYGRDVPYCFNRKETKHHGEGGNIVGAPLEGRILIVDDVITAGTAVRESMDLIEAAGAQAAGVVIALDRQERGSGSCSAVQEVEDTFGISVVSVVGVTELLDYLGEQSEMQKHLKAMREYQAEYGVCLPGH
ncbi:MAG: orotate phosphoribosyltransferase, partial [Gammaproteobacteria bacterium]